MSALREQGFEVIPSVFDRTTVGALISALDNAPIRRSRAGARNVLSIEAVAFVAHDSRLMILAKRALGDSAFPFRATLFDKSPRSNWLVVWHQDTALPVCERRDIGGWGPWSLKEGIVCAHAPAHALEQVLAIRVHLDDSGERNGPLRVLPGTHSKGVLTDDAMHELSARIDPFTCCVSAGGVVTMKPLLVHASSKLNSGASPRRVLHIEYAATADLQGGIRLRVC